MGLNISHVASMGLWYIYQHENRKNQAILGEKIPYMDLMGYIGGYSFTKPGTIALKLQGSKGSADRFIIIWAWRVKFLHLGQKRQLNLDGTGKTLAFVVGNGREWHFNFSRIYIDLEEK